jgi:hypothetical protein
MMPKASLINLCRTEGYIIIHELYYLKKFNGSLSENEQCKRGEGELMGCNRRTEDEWVSNIKYNSDHLERRNLFS